MSSGIASRFVSARASFRNCIASSSLSPRARRMRVQRGAQEIGVADAGQLDRVLERQEQAGGGALLGLHRQQVEAVEA